MSSKVYGTEAVSEDYLLAVQRGEIDGAKMIWKFGFHTAASTNIETIWNGGGLYTYHLGYGVDAKAIDIVSSSAADTVTIGVVGLDADGYEQEEYIVLNGTTPVTSTLTYSRVYRAWNDNGVDLVGDISISETGQPGNVVAVIIAEENQTLMSIYTIPNGYTGYLIKGTANIGSGKEATITFTIRLKDKVFRTQEKLPLYQSVLEASRPFNPIPELTDIEVRATATQMGNKVGSTFGIVLIRN